MSGRLYTEETNPKLLLILLIKNRGDCARRDLNHMVIPCSKCPVFYHSTARSCLHTQDSIYKLAVEKYIKLYSMEDLIEVLI